MTVLRCKVAFSHWISQTEEAVFTVVDGVKTDLRKNPPFHQILPCPYCWVEEDKNHYNLDHVDSRLGTPLVPTQER